MLIIKIIGGLGNQLFQYAYCRNVANYYGESFALDTSTFESYKLHNLHLNSLNIKERYATQNEVAMALNKRLSIIDYIKPYYRRSYIKERTLNFDANMLKVPPNAYLDGYWQSEKYFKPIEHIIRREFMVKSNPDRDNLKMMAKILKSKSSVCIHVRRGDYVSNQLTNQVHGTCSLEYYQEAVDYIGKKISEPHFYIFSDDPSWTKANLKFKYPTTFVTHNAKAGHEDLRLMGLCQHFIIANSTFSWWGAWLSSNRSKIVVAPNQWYKTTDRPTDDLLPNSWVRL